MFALYRRHLLEAIEMGKKYWLFSLLLGIIAGLFLRETTAIAIAVGIIVVFVAVVRIAYKLRKARRKTSTVDILFDAAIVSSIIVAVASLFVSGLNWPVAIFVFLLFVVIYGILALLFIVLCGNKYVLTGNTVGWG